MEAFPACKVLINEGIVKKAPKIPGERAPLFYLDANLSLRPWPALNFGRRAAGMVICSLVRGLRPVLSARSWTENVPKPTKRTTSPASSELVIASITLLRALFASVLEKPDKSAMAETRSCLFTFADLLILERLFHPEQEDIVPIDQDTHCYGAIFG